MQKLVLLVVFFLLSVNTHVKAQEGVSVDGRLQPILDEFIEYCKKYDIEYHTKLFQLKRIDIVDDLPLSENNTILGMVSRDENGNINEIKINWAALLDNEILKVVAFHEFAHHFLDYKHSCKDCNEIMAETNVSYFEVVRDWDAQVELLFTTSPIYLSKDKENAITQIELF